MLFEGYDLVTLLRDLRSVKMPQRDRARACALAKKATFTADDVGEAWALVRRWRKQLQDVHEARERARCSLGRRILGMTRVEVEAVAAERRKAESERREDLGL